MHRTCSSRKLRRRLSLPLLLLLAGVLGSCRPARPLTWTPPPPAPVIQGSSEVLILPLGEESAEQVAYWTLESQRLVLAYFDIFLRHGFRERTSSNVIVAGDGFEPAGLEFAYQSMRGSEGEEWWGFVPQRGRIAHEGRYPDYVLIFDGLRFSIRRGGGSRQTYDTPGAGGVQVDLDYILWDNQAQTVVASGQLHEEAATNSPHASSRLFKDLFERMAERVVRESPLAP